MNTLKLKILPVTLEEKEGVFSYTNWVLPQELNAPKPRNVMREHEVPPQDLSLNNLPNVLPFVEVLPEISVAPGGQEIRQVTSSEADVLVVSGGRSDTIRFLVQFGKAILPRWDNWGYVWNIRYLPAKDVYTFTPFGAQEVRSILRALYAKKFLQEMRVLYLGDLPSHTVSQSNYNFSSMRKKFGTLLMHRSLTKYVTAVDQASEAAASQVAASWINEYHLSAETIYNLEKYAKIYVALRELLQKEKANALTMDCANLPSAEYVPCFSVSRLIDEGIVWACEGDISALLAMAILMSVSGEAALMGNIFENNTHQDIENNIIVINHEILPPSMRCSDCQLTLHDFHGTGKGLTGYANLTSSAWVTLFGLSYDSNEAWVIPGKIAWTENTVHCRVSVGVKVDDAKRVAKAIGGHHQALVYGDWREEIKLVSQLLEIKLYEL